MKNKVLVLGFFGYLTNQLDGQTVKTRNVYDLLKSKEEEIGSLDYFDTEQFQYSKLAIFKMLSLILNCEKLIYLPAQKNLKYIFPFIFIISRMRRINIIYLVVGGWLDEFLQTKKMHVAMLSRIKVILSESVQLSQNLLNLYQLTNVFPFPNFRMHSFVPSFNQNPDHFKIVFMARIFREKGIDTVFRLADCIQKNYGNKHSITIDFYGPIQDDEADYFNEEIKKYNFVSYKFVLEPDQIYLTLDQYDLLVFPTRFPDEGFPGTILDAYISGIPVIISNWRFLPEFVDIGLSGYVFDLDNEKDFCFYIDQLYNDRVQLLNMKHCAYEKSKEYSSDKAWGILKKYLQC